MKSNTKIAESPDPEGFPRRSGPQPPEAVNYVRCSDPKQAEKDLSIPAQERACLAAAERAGYTGCITFADPGITGTKDKRPGFQEAIQFALKSPGVKAFIVYDTSRFARNRMDSLMYKVQLRKADIKIVYATQPIGDDPDSEMMEGILELFDARFSKVLSRVTLRGMLEKAMKGEAPGGRASYGYRRAREGEARPAKGPFVFDDVEIEAVRLIYQAAQSGIGKKAIVNLLKGGKRS